MADLEHGPTMLVATLKQRCLKYGYKLATVKKNVDVEYPAFNMQAWEDRSRCRASEELESALRVCYVADTKYRKIDVERPHKQIA